MSKTRIVDLLVRLQCRMVGCVRDGKEWRRWAAQHLPALWRDCDDCAFTFCVRAHQLFVRKGKAKFADWRWDFLSVLFDSSFRCNCVCHTLAVAAAAEYVGLFPERIQVYAGPAHVWIGAHCKHRQGIMFLETTLRPGQMMYTLSEAEGRNRSIYGRGAWFTYTDSWHVVQEAFINQVLLTKPGDKVRHHLYELLQDMAKEQKDPSQMILDFRKLRVRQLTSLQNRYSLEQHMLIKSMIKTIATSKWPIEAYMKSVFFVQKWYTWLSLCCPNQGPQDDLKHERKIISTFVNELQRRNKRNLWTRECDSLRKLHDGMKRIEKAWSKIE